MERIPGLQVYDAKTGESEAMVLKTIRYDPWESKETKVEYARRVLRAHYWLQAREWRDSVSPLYIQTVHTLWKESLGSHEDSVKPFLAEVQGIIDEKIAANEPYDRRSYLTYLRLKGLISYAARPEITVEDVKSKIQMQDLAGRYVELRKSGSNFVCRCPFHDDKHPSACIYTKSNTFKCFSCGEYHDVIGFLMKIENIDFKQALNRLSNNI